MKEASDPLIFATYLISSKCNLFIYYSMLNLQACEQNRFGTEL